MLEEADAADAAGGDDAAWGEGVEAAGGFGDEDVFDGGAGEDGADFESWVEEGRDVFEAVDGGVDGALAEGDFEFFGEDAFIDDGLVAFGEVGEAEVGAKVAIGFDDGAQDGEVGPRGLEGGGGEDGLGEGEFAAAGSEGQGEHGRTGRGRRGLGRQIRWDRGGGGEWGGGRGGGGKGGRL